MQSIFPSPSSLAPGQAVFNCPSPRVPRPLKSRGPHSKDSWPWAVETHRPLWKPTDTDPLSCSWAPSLQRLGGPPGCVRMAGRRTGLGKRKDSQEQGMTELRKIRYESYILLDMKLVVTPERSGFVGRTLRRTAWSRDAFLNRAAVAGAADASPSQPSRLGRGRNRKVGAPEPSEPALKKGSSVSRLSSRSPKRAGSWGQARESRKGHTGWEGPGKALGTRKSRGRMGSPGGREAGAEEAAPGQGSLGEGEAEASEDAEVAGRRSKGAV